MARRTKRALTEEWIKNQAPTKRVDVADGGCKGLWLRLGPESKVFSRWVMEGGKSRREVLGRFPAMSLAEAQAKVHAARETKREASGAPVTVAQIAESYRKDLLSQRERADEAWNIIRVHVVEAQPDPNRPVFGTWLARDVKPSDVAMVVRYAKEPRKVGERTVGGPGVALVVLRELRAIFANAVETATLEMTRPAC